MVTNVQTQGLVLLPIGSNVQNSAILEMARTSLKPDYIFVSLTILHISCLLFSKLMIMTYKYVRWQTLKAAKYFFLKITQIYCYYTNVTILAHHHFILWFVNFFSYFAKFRMPNRVFFRNAILKGC